MINMLDNLPSNWLSTSLGKKIDKYYSEAKKEITKNLEKCKKYGLAIAEKDHEKYFSYSLAGLELGAPTFLCNPQWKNNEWEDIAKAISPAFFFGDNSLLKSTALRDLTSFQNYVMIPTGGSAGNVKFAIHTWSNLVHSALATKNLLKHNTINSLCCLPVYHVSGFMQYIRALITSGTTQYIHWSDIEKLKLPRINKDTCVTSLVPTQLKRLLNNPKRIEWLKKFKAIFIGGAPTPEPTLEIAQTLKLPLVLTYGMTETASMIAALSIEDFHKGKRGVGQPLEHSHLFLNEKK